MTTLSEYYQGLGYPGSRWHIGREHPHLEEYAIRLLHGMPRAKVLEVGYQAGGFAVPVILAMRGRPDFTYLGIDSMAYENAVGGKVIAQYLRDHDVIGCYEFVERDAGEFLARMPLQQFDLVLIDHSKSLYPREFRTLVRRGLVSPYGYTMFHDVLGEAREVWRDCVVIARSSGYSWSIVSEIPEGLAVVRQEGLPQGITWLQCVERHLVDLRISIRQARSAIGRLRQRIRGKG